MDFSVFLTFVVFTASMIYLTFGRERERAMLFPDYFFFAERRLVNYAIEDKHVKNLHDCELLCYLNDNCVSLNFKKEPENNKPGHICELNNATHLKYDSDLTADENFYYRGSKSACDKNLWCHNNATCQSGFTLKGYRCLCPGFDGEHCENDTNECEATPRKCHVNATCNNTYGSYVCTCKPGFTGDGKNCTDIDECKGNHSCHVNAICTNTMGSRDCQCHSGYTGNGQNCTDIDECKGNHSCHVNANCVNTIGSHVCKCHPGYTGSGHNCAVDPCYSYQNLSEAYRRSSYTGTVTNLCDHHFPRNNEPEKWYRFVGAAGTKMPTTRVKTHHCGTTWSGWLKNAHPTVEKSEVSGMVCFSDRSAGCKKTLTIAVRNCGSYYIYKLFKPSECPSRYCGTD